MVNHKQTMLFHISSLYSSFVSLDFSFLICNIKDLNFTRDDYRLIDYGPNTDYKHFVCLADTNFKSVLNLEGHML